MTAGSGFPGSRHPGPLEPGALVPAGGLFVLEADVAGFSEFAATWADTNAHLLLAASKAGASPLLTA